jgi:Ubiquitin carboxyl-terminal hydrolase
MSRCSLFSFALILSLGRYFRSSTRALTHIPHAHSHNLSLAPTHPQFVRFYWKQKAGVRNKIVRPVVYPEQLDLFEFCTDDLKAKLKVRRDRQQQDEDIKFGFKKINHKNKQEKKTSGAASSSSSSSSSTSSSSATDAQPMDTSKEEGEDVIDLAPLPQSPPFENDTGRYELMAVLTHQGLSAEGGHYVAWVRDEKNPGTSIIPTYLPTNLHAYTYTCACTHTHTHTHVSSVVELSLSSWCSPSLPRDAFSHLHARVHAPLYPSVDCTACTYTHTHHTHTHLNITARLVVPVR